MHIKKIIINKLKSLFSNDNLMYTSQLSTHKHICEHCYKTFLENNDLYTLYKNLIKNLDDKSILIVTTMISRIQQAIKNNKKFVISEEEKKLFYNRNFHNQNIVKLANNIYTNGKHFLPVKHFISTIFIDNHFIDEINNKNLIKNKAIIDVGAFIGDSALLFAQLTTNKVYAFEPVKANYDKMLETIKLNSAYNIIPLQLGLGSKNINDSINIFDNGVSSTLRPDRKNTKGSNQEIIKIIRLDDYVNENNLSVGLIKVDIEGLEKDFLKGAIETIKQQRPVLMISIYHTAEDLFTIKPLIESWNLGYKFKIRKSSKPSILDDTILIAECYE